MNFEKGGSHELNSSSTFIDSRWNGKGSGLGDCGQLSVTSIEKNKWSGVQVITTEIRAKINCDGEVETDWPAVFKQ